MSKTIMSTARSAWALWGAQWRTLWRSKRLLILAALFALLGLANPLTAELTPTLLKSTIGGAQLAQLIPDPDSVSSWAQFYKSMTQLGIYLLAIFFSNMISQEVSAGTLVNLVTKGLPRPTLIAVKYCSALSQWMLSILLAFSITWGYTLYYFPDRHSPHPLVALLPLLAFGIFFIAVIAFGSSLGHSPYSGLLVLVIVQAGLMILNTFEQAKRFNPISLISDNMSLLQGQEQLSHVLPAFIVSLGASAFLLASSTLILNHKRL
ncbi:ABC transporter permease [Bombiscardovia nodaiensis]|uniref:ABC transporter permease n=1 Tax=Bombiscardovia nodaiensis TaxID=2932181 RepID=A0ABN6SC75_9BIFI|nr:ABC transporter permease [Bombiscardovia nodaiensis]